MKALVTGASGLVGTALCRRLRRERAWVRAAVRRPGPVNANADDTVVVGDIDGATRWAAALAGIDVVFHLAARVHIVRDSDPDPAARFTAVNVDGTAALARAAVSAGVSRVVYASSVKVHGDDSDDRDLREDDPPRLDDPYGRSKWQAEETLRAVCAGTAVEVAVVRPPLVYGPGVRANFLALVETVHRGVPLPFAATRNRRSLISVQNLASALIACASHSDAAGQAFFAADDEVVSTAELIRGIAGALGRPARLFPDPTALLRIGARLIGKQAAMARLTGSLALDTSRIRSRLGWQPAETMAAGLSATAQWFLARRGPA